MPHRDCQAWAEAGMPLSTPSNEAAKLLDIAIKQFTTNQPEPPFENLIDVLDRAIQADPHCVMVHVLKTLLLFPDGGLSVASEKCQSILNTFHENIKPSRLVMTEWEKKHVAAIQHLANGHFDKATDTWEQILSSSPTDVLALRVPYFPIQVYIGKPENIKNTFERCLPHFKKSDWAYGYIEGLYAFGLQECGFYKDAEMYGKEALTLNKTDAWTTHSLAHVYEETARYEEGMNFMNSTVENWKPNRSMACHNLWHNTLFYLEKMDIEGALTLVDQELLPIVKNECSGIAIADAASMLKRMEVVGVKVGKERWQVLNEAYEAQTRNVFPYYDLNLFMACCGAKDTKHQEQFMKSCEEFCENYPDAILAKKWNRATKTVCEALMHDSMQNWSEVVTQLSDLHSSGFIDVGGSHAQRDVLTLVLTNAAMKNTETRSFARDILDSRKTLRDTPFTQQLLQQLVAAGN